MKRLFVSLLILALTAAFVLSGCSEGIQMAQQNEVAQPNALEEHVAQLTVSVKDDAQLSYISIDINPSIKLTIKDGIVLKAEAFNDDGEQIVLESHVTELSPNEAIIMIVAVIAAQGYIDQDDASIVITACGDKGDEFLGSLEDTAKQALADLGLECEVVASQVSNQVVEDAKASGLTPGRYKLLSYIAAQESISLDEAKDKYGALKMGALIAMVDDVGAVFGSRAGVDQDAKDAIDWADATEGLTAEQQELLNQAINEFEVAMRTAQREFLQTKMQVQNQVKAQRSDIQNAYRSSKNLSEYKESKTALKKQYDAQKREARQVFFEAKTLAKQRFREAIAQIGLSDTQINTITGWSFDPKWDDQLEFEPEEANKDNKEQKEGAGPGVNNGNNKGKAKQNG